MGGSSCAIQFELQQPDTFANSDEHSACHVASKLCQDKTNVRIQFGFCATRLSLPECRQLGESVERLTLSVTDEVSTESFPCRIAPSQNGKKLALIIGLLRAPGGKS